MYNYYYFIMFLVLIWKFDQKSDVQPRLALARPYKGRKGPNRGENEIFKS